MARRPLTPSKILLRFFRSTFVPTLNLSMRATITARCINIEKRAGASKLRELCVAMARTDRRQYI